MNINMTDFLHYFKYTLFKVGDTPISTATLLGLVVIVVLAWLMSIKAEALIKRALFSRAKNNSDVYALARMVRYLIWIVSTVFGLQYIGFDLTSFALIGGAVGVGIGFGLQNIFSNFISGIIMLFEKTVKVGDYVDLQSGVMGLVREIGLRYTLITTNDAIDIIVPNAEFINNRVTNWTHANSLRRIHISFGVAYGSDKNLVKKAALEAAALVPATYQSQPDKKPDVWLVKFGDSSLDFELIVWVDREALVRPAYTNAQYLWVIEDKLREYHIEIPFPQRDIHIRDTRVVRE